MVALLAGAVAESLVLGGYDEIGVMVDWDNASALLVDLGHFDGGDALWAWTFDFLAQHLDLIARVADALWDLKALDGCEIVALLAE